MKSPHRLSAPRSTDQWGGGRAEQSNLPRHRVAGIQVMMPPPLQTPHSPNFRTSGSTWACPQTAHPNLENTMREVTFHRTGSVLNEGLKITAVDDPAPPESGNANHEYEIEWQENLEDGSGTEGMACRIDFQKGAVAEAGYNGVSCESLLAVVADRLTSYQAGP